tara:strand:+ start:1419 stop:2246 length:828 start_codon:yes stop_codon:yes gene_type:complete
MDRDFIVNNLVAGVYTHRDKYFKQFTDNWQNHYANVELIYQVEEGKINENMELLRHKFMDKDKRYWLFMDEDILFTRNDVIEKALDCMIKNDLDLVSVYQITDQELANKLGTDNLKFTHLTWVAGYFMLVDSKKSGLIPFDLELPTTHGSLSDISYSMDIIKNQGLIGMAPTFVYHADEGYSPKISVPFKLNKTNKLSITKKAEDFIKNLDKKLLYNNPNLEIILLDNGEIDYNETIGHHYLKNKHADIYHRVVARPSYYHLKEVKKINTFTNQI